MATLRSKILLFKYFPSFQPFSVSWSWEDHLLHILNFFIFKIGVIITFPFTVLLKIKDRVTKPVSAVWSRNGVIPCLFWSLIIFWTTERMLFSLDSKQTKLVKFHHVSLCNFCLSLLFIILKLGTCTKHTIEGKSHLPCLIKGEAVTKTIFVSMLWGLLSLGIKNTKVENQQFPALSLWTT